MNKIIALIAGLAVMASVTAQETPQAWGRLAELTWSPTVLNEDGTVADDIVAYEVVMVEAGLAINPETIRWSVATTNNRVNLDIPLDLADDGMVYEFAVRARDAAGNPSREWTRLRLRPDKGVPGPVQDVRLVRTTVITTTQVEVIEPVVTPIGQ